MTEEDWLDQDPNEIKLKLKATRDQLLIRYLRSIKESLGIIGLIYLIRAIVDLVRWMNS